MRPRFYLAVIALWGLAPLAFAASGSSWGPAWQKTVPAGGPVSLTHALLAIAPSGQTVVVDLPGALKKTRVSWPAGTRKAALRAAVLAANRTAAIALGERCDGRFVTVYARSGDLAQALAANASGSHGAYSPSMALVSASAPSRSPASRPPMPPAHRVWLISKGERMSAALDHWGAEHGWTVLWKSRRLARRWRAPAFAAIPGTFLSAVGLWAQSAISNGAPIRLIEYHANNTLVVESTDGADNGF